ncbi:pseudouridine synthase [Lactococcus hodotermopsidis]|uniref:Pseudouridine synthase n=1 Tax=Pseudolactococcus hodotermopsidis TaxID=2709157 RepID=A0A6A0B827_9LACT|nr:pseudouridine synthase [Lactococcus hodotermopsidis]GFH41500.1 pseudouridine synthase [Lactococcus hodotermopsidis]
MRIDDVLVNFGNVPKSQVKKMLRENRVTVDDKNIRAMNFQVDSAVNEVKIDEKKVSFPAHRYYMLNKPIRTLSANFDSEKKVVFDLFSADFDRTSLYIIGRLDFLSDGLLLITDNGKLGRNMLKPEAHVAKVYEVETKEPLHPDDSQKFRHGLLIDGTVQLAPAKLIITAPHTATVTISEGKNRQIRKMFLSLGKLVTRLTRKQIGPIVLDENLTSGEFRALTRAEIQKLSSYFN